jgi:hypothetical protein
MPRGIPSKSTVKPPTIRERALEDDPSTVGMMARVDLLHVDMPQPLVTIRLRRVGAIITDSLNTVSIPAPAFLKDGERVLVAIYQTEGDWRPIEPRTP